VPIRTAVQITPRDGSESVNLAAVTDRTGSPGRA
jgi:hypothetical protein